ncbi:MAG: nucleotidyltransferase family protein [Rhodospirillaceae bacterium]|nr:nucleotidyltransferase family protein [Rhodospirillaceae bacterium]
MSAIKTAMVLAAGFGVRMKPLTDTRPKPLIQVLGRTLIDRTIDRLAEAGVERVVVNTHHLSEQIHDHLSKRDDLNIAFSPEDMILETGGGVAHALSMLGDDAFFVCNADSLWLNGSQDALKRLNRHWLCDGSGDDSMDGLLMVHSTVDAYGYGGLGDFGVDPLGLVSRRPENEVSAYLFTGVQILHPRLFKGAPEGAFSLNVLYDRAIEGDRLYAMVHDGEWFHVGTPEELAVAENYMTLRYSGIKHR